MGRSNTSAGWSWESGVTTSASMPSAAMKPFFTPTSQGSVHTVPSLVTLIFRDMMT